MLWWLLAGLLIATGIVGTLLPGLPGPILVYAGLFIAAWADGFARVGAGTLVVLGLLTAAAYAIDLMASALGVKRAGASRRAVVGAALGALAGLFFGLPGFVIGPFIGALAGELTVRGDLRLASRAGLFAWLGFVIGLATKVAIVFAMLGLALTAFVLF